jgi:RecA-family ATPase
MSKIIRGEKLRDDLMNLQITRQPILDELIFERDIFMISADAGAGKSILALNLACKLSMGIDSFLGCKVKKQSKVLYIQLEGDYEESIERMRFMESGGLRIITFVLWRRNCSM